MRNLIKKILKESEDDLVGSPKEPLRGDYIFCIEPVMVDGVEKATTKGKYYKVRVVRNEYGIKKIMIRNDNNDEHTLTPTNDFFKRHFIYVPKQEYDEENYEFFD